MLQGLLSAIVETLFMAVGDAILKFLGWEKAAELVGCLIGLGCIAIGFTIWWRAPDAQSESEFHVRDIVRQGASWAGPPSTLEF